MIGSFRNVPDRDLKTAWWELSDRVKPWIFAGLVVTGLILEVIVHVIFHISTVYTLLIISSSLLQGFGTAGKPSE